MPPVCAGLVVTDAPLVVKVRVVASLFCVEEMECTSTVVFWVFVSVGCGMSVLSNTEVLCASVGCSGFKVAFVRDPPCRV